MYYDSNDPKHAAQAKAYYDQYDKKLDGMDRRAQIAEIILGLVIVFIVNCMCFACCKMNKKDDRNMRMNVQVKEEVS